MSRLGLLALACFLFTGCMRNVGITIASEPQGGYVIAQFQSAEDPANADWLFLGTTPISIVRRLDVRDVSSDQMVRMKVLKEGYFDAIKEWSGDRFFKEVREKGGIFWNPHLVPARAGETP